jgi:hypothetical protein
MSVGTKAGRWMAFLAAATAVSAATTAVVEPGQGAADATAGTLELRGQLRLVSRLGACPPGVTATACGARTGKGVLPGLGTVSETYTFAADIGSPPCSAGFGRALAYPIVFKVAEKGEIHLALAAGAECVGQEAVRTQTQPFTVTGGTGIYVGASGSGTVERVLGGETAGGRVGRETWTGTLVVPGLDFDVTPPVLSGTAAKTVRAPRKARAVRVRFTVTARDAADGVVPVRCAPRSGSRFKLGKTRVTCAAADTSGNTSTARFVVTVKARR